MRIKLDVVAWTAAAALVVGAAVVGATANAAGDSGATTTASRDDVVRVKQATDKYHDLNVALADGYTKAGECVVDPAGTGTMGYHYVNLAMESDPAIDLEKPEAMLYIPNDQGDLELVAVEWIRDDADQDLNTDEDRPFLFGLPFDGPMLGHGPGRPIHYDLHAWVWRNNPSGMFKQYNPAISCPAP